MKENMTLDLVSFEMKFLSIVILVVWHTVRRVKMPKKNGSMMHPAKNHANESIVSDASASSRKHVEF